MAKEMDLKKIMTNLAKLGVSASLTKSRLDILNTLMPPPATKTQIHSH
jgi:hypothetical protein